MVDYGITTELAPVNQLTVGDVKYFSVPVKASEGALAIGQVLQYDTTANAFVKYTSGSAANAYAIVAEAVTVTDAQRVLSIVSGDVRLSALDATAQADAEILGALLGQGIRPLAGVV